MEALVYTIVGAVLGAALGLAIAEARDRLRRRRLRLRTEEPLRLLWEARENAQNRYNKAIELWMKGGHDPAAALITHDTLVAFSMQISSIYVLLGLEGVSETIVPPNEVQLPDFC